MPLFRTPVFRLVPAVVALAAAGLLSGCGGGSAGERTVAADRAGDGKAGGTDSPGDDIAVAALEAVGATKVDFGPDEVRVHFPGSVDDAIAWTYCTAAKALIGPKAAIVVYSDGELACADRSAG